MQGEYVENVELFLDDELMSSKDNIKVCVEIPVRYSNPIIKAEYPWESGGVSVYGSVVVDDGLFRMWYMACGENGTQAMCHASSEDGINWGKTMLGKISYGNTKRTNIVMGPDINIHGPCVIRNPDRSDRKHKFLVFFDSYSKYRPENKQVQSEARWTYTASSPDGFDWSPQKGNPAVPGKSDTGQSVVWNPEGKTFGAYMRGVMYDGNKQRIRYVRLATSKDFKSWTPPVELLRNENPNDQMHQFSVTKYNNIYIGLLSIFHIHDLAVDTSGVPDYNSRPYPEIASCDTWLTVSRDGVNWEYVSEYQPLLGLRPGYWDGMFINTASQLLFHDKQIWIYYAGKPTMQGENEPSIKAIGLARLPQDRLAAIEPSTTLSSGFVELKPSLYEKDELKLNVKTVDGGKVHIEICDLNGNIIRGFSKEDCIPIKSDTLAESVKWSTPKGIKGFADAVIASDGTPLQIRFYLNKAKL